MAFFAPARQPFAHLCASGKCDSAGKVYYLPRMTSIIFDLDGTLIDTAPDLIATLNVILTREGFAPVALDEARNAIGAGAKPLLQRGLAKHGNAVSPARLDALYNEYLEYYAAHIADHSRPFPGLDAALDTLEKDGFTFAVCTNNFKIQETFDDYSEPWVGQLLPGAPVAKDGWFELPDRPGLGIELNEAAVKAVMKSDKGYFEPTPEWDPKGRINDRLWS